MSDQSSPPPFKLPTAGPSAADVADRELWEKTAEGSLASVQAAAEKWRTGLAAFVTLVTGGLLIKGPEAADDLGDQWLLAISILGGGGLLLAVIGLWDALRAAAGSPSAVRYEDVAAQHGSFRSSRSQALPLRPRPSHGHGRSSAGRSLCSAPPSSCGGGHRLNPPSS